MLKVFLDLLAFGSKDSNAKFVLTSTAVAHTFCRNHPECWRYGGIQRILEFLEQDLDVQLQEDVSKRAVRERVSFIDFNS